MEKVHDDFNHKRAEMCPRGKSMIENKNVSLLLKSHYDRTARIEREKNRFQTRETKVNELVKSQYNL